MSDYKLLGDRYEVGEVLGRGGMATVRRARDARLGREVAVKELRIDLASDSTFQERFRREAQASAGLNHPNIVSVYDTGEQKDANTGVSVPYIVMELISGRTLRDILRDGRPILPRKALEFTLGVLDALAYSHKAGIVHRDIKPANVMITSAGLIKVMDFGIARAVSDTSSTMTQTAAVIGTAQYLSPEQARGETVDSRSDIYSAGCLLYELLVGRPPFTGESPVSVAYQHVREAPVPPSQLDAEVTPAMDAVVLKALAKDPHDRYQTASEMAADIRRLLDGQPVQAVAPVFPPAVPTGGATASAQTAPTSVYGPGTRYADVEPGTGPLALATDGVPERRRRGGWVLPTMITLLVIGLIAGGVLLFTQRKTQVTVPGVKGLEQAAAEVLIRERNLNPVVKSVQGADDDTKGRVTDSNPPAGTLVDPGANVTLTVNVGPNKVLLPSGLVGQNVEQVKATLTQLGFTNVNVLPATTEPATAVANQVLSVDPTEGTRIAPGQLVTLYYATGKATVPNLRTYECAQAATLAGNAGFVKTSQVPRADGSVKAGTVIDTSPLPGEVANKADPLTIYCAVAPPVTPTVTITSTTTQPPTTATTTNPTSTAPTSASPSP